MEKKIIAVACALLTLVLAFTACGKATVTGDNGIEYEAVTDEEGNTVVNEDGDIVVYVTDARGDRVTDANGEPQTNSITFPSAIVDGQTVETADYTLTMPEGWTADDNGKFQWDEDETTFVQVVNLRTLDDGTTMESYVATTLANIETSVEKAREKYPEAAVEASDCVVEATGGAGKQVKLSVPNTDGTMLIYAENIYFVHGGALYRAEYICQGTTVSDFDLLAVINAGLTFKN